MDDGSNDSGLPSGDLVRDGGVGPAGASSGPATSDR